MELLMESLEESLEDFWLPFPMKFLGNPCIMKSLQCCSTHTHLNQPFTLNEKYFSSIYNRIQELFNN